MVIIGSKSCPSLIVPFDQFPRLGSSESFWSLMLNNGAIDIQSYNIIYSALVHSHHVRIPRCREKVMYVTFFLWGFGIWCFFRTVSFTMQYSSYEQDRQRNACNSAHQIPIVSQIGVMAFTNSALERRRFLEGWKDGLLWTIILLGDESILLGFY